MEKQITEKSWWYAVDGNEGIDFIPDDLADVSDEEIAAANEAGIIPSALRDYCNSTRLCEGTSKVFGYGVRLSAPGYLDCTEWSVYTNRKEAKRALRDLAGDE